MKIGTFVDLLLHDRPKLVARALRSRFATSAEDTVLRLFRSQPGLTSEIELCILGMRRSGNHAIIEWFLGNGDSCFGRSAFLNNLPPKENGFRHRLWYPEELTSSYRDLYEQCRWKRFPPGGLGILIRSYEDYSFDQFQEGLYNRFYYGSSRRFLRAIIVRDPLNLFASRIRSGYTDTHIWDQVSLYVDHITALERDPDVICIDFNDFINSSEYRNCLLDRVGLVGSENSTPLQVSPFGGGSSFGDSVASVEDLSRRFLQMRGDPSFEQVMHDPRIEGIVQRRYPDLYQIAYTS